MSTKEMAYNIFNQLNEEQLEGFIALFGKFYPQTEQKTGEDEFKKLEAMIKPVPDFDYEKELEEWKKEKFGI
jgi:hypothetical protein